MHSLHTETTLRQGIQGCTHFKYFGSAILIVHSLYSLIQHVPITSWLPELTHTSTSPDPQTNPIRSTQFIISGTQNCCSPGLKDFHTACLGFLRSPRKCNNGLVNSMLSLPRFLIKMKSELPWSIFLPQSPHPQYMMILSGKEM